MPEISRRNHEPLQDCVQSSKSMTRGLKMPVLIKLGPAPPFPRKKRTVKKAEKTVEIKVNGLELLIHIICFLTPV